MTTPEIPGGFVRPVWMPSDPTLALCRQTDPDAFFAEEDDEGGMNANMRAAVRTCMRCELRIECLDAAVDANEQYGIWGGMGRQGRAKYRRQRNAARRAAAAAAEPTTLPTPPEAPRRRRRDTKRAA